MNIIMSRSARPTVREGNTSHMVSDANKGKKVKLIVQIYFAEKIKFKGEGCLTFQNIFSSIAYFRDVVSVLSCSPTREERQEEFFLALRTLFIYIIYVKFCTKFLHSNDITCTTHILYVCSTGTG